MNNTVKMSVKCALLLSLLGTNISLSYAAPTYDDVLKQFETLKAEKDKSFNDASLAKERFDKYNSDTTVDLQTQTDLNQKTKDLVNAVIAEIDTTSNDNKAKLEDIKNDIVNHKTQLDKNNTKLIDTKVQFESIYNATNSNINANSKGIANNKEMVNGLQKQFSNLKNEFADYKTATNGAIAGVAAMGMLTTPQGIGHTAISAGAGYYGGETAIAVGVTHNIDALTIRAGASYSTGSSQPVLGAGVGYEF